MVILLRVILAQFQLCDLVIHSQLLFLPTAAESAMMISF
jgi:hypothetical protein